MKSFPTQLLPNTPFLFPRKVLPAKENTGKKPINKSSTPSWWTPVWRGLIADPESRHRKAMGSAVWLYLYLLTYSNRTTGIVRRTQGRIKTDTGYPVRTIQFQLKRLHTNGYITKEHSGRYLKITINKWKSFRQTK